LEVILNDVGVVGGSGRAQGFTKGSSQGMGGFETA